MICRGGACHAEALVDHLWVGVPAPPRRGGVCGTGRVVLAHEDRHRRASRASRCCPASTLRQAERVGAVIPPFAFRRRARGAAAQGCPDWLGCCRAARVTGACRRSEQWRASGWPARQLRFCQERPSASDISRRAWSTSTSEQTWARQRLSGACAQPRRGLRTARPRLLVRDQRLDMAAGHERQAWPWRNPDTELGPPGRANPSAGLAGPPAPALCWASPREQDTLALPAPPAGPGAGSLRLATSSRHHGGIVKPSGPHDIYGFTRSSFMGRYPRARRPATVSSGVIRVRYVLAGSTRGFV